MQPNYPSHQLISCSWARSIIAGCKFEGTSDALQLDETLQTIEHYFKEEL